MCQARGECNVLVGSHVARGRGCLLDPTHNDTPTCIKLMHIHKTQQIKSSQLASQQNLMNLKNTFACGLIKKKLYMAVCATMG